MTRSLILAGLVAALAACGDDVTATVVTVRAQPAVRSVAELTVTLINGTSTETATFDLRGRELPATFSVTTPERAGTLEIDATGRDATGVESARGTASSAIVRGKVVDAELVLVPSDFPVNTIVANDQRTIFFEGNQGRQIASNANGDFTIGYSDDCGDLARCDVWGRNFDRRSRPVVTAVVGSDAQFNLNRSATPGTDPAVAVGPNGNRVAVWWTGETVLCVGFDPAGTAVTQLEVPLSTPGLIPQEPSIVALEAGRYAVTWEENNDADASVIRAMLIDDACAAQVNTITNTAAAFDVSRAAAAPIVLDHPVVAANGGRLGFVWRNGTTLRGRFSDADGRFAGEIEVLADSGARLGGQQLVATADGFLVAFSAGKAAEAGDVRVRRLSRAGTAEGADSILAPTVGEAQAGPAIARRADGAIAVAWHACDFLDQDPECGIRGRLVRDTGLPVGAAFHVNTTTLGRQSDPSVAALPDAFAITWTDVSGVAPDTSGAGIRARVVYPAFDAPAVIGAACGGSAPACGEGLACLAGSDGVAHCHAACDPEGPAPQCPDGGVCTDSAGVTGCIF